MCSQCNYPQLLKTTGLGSTPNRLRVMEIIGNNNCPLSAREIYNTLNRTQGINRVTVYRILDLLVENDLIERIIATQKSLSMISDQRRREVSP